MLLPFFILIFAGVFYLERLWENAQLALLTARRCAWEYSNSGCTVSREGCAGLVRNAGGERAENEFTGQMRAGGGLDGSSDIPIVGRILEGFFGSAARVEVSRKTKRPLLLGGGEDELPVRYYLMCNAKKQTLDGVVGEVFCASLGEFLGACRK